GNVAVADLVQDDRGNDGQYVVKGSHEAKLISVMGAGVGVGIDTLQRGYRDRGIDLRGGDRGVTQQLLNHADIRPMGQHVRGTTVAKDVGTDRRSVDVGAQSA